MIAKKYRVPLNRFPAKTKIIFRGEYFFVKALPNNLAHNRIGVLVSRRVVKKAVLRNKIQRRVFNFARLENLIKMRGTRAKDLLIVVNQPPGEIDLKKDGKFKKELNAFLKQLKKDGDAF